MQCCPDSLISNFISNGTISVGTKLLVSSAVLVGADDGVDPLAELYDAFKGPVLKIFANSTRIARWNAKLGFVRPTRTVVDQDGLFLVKKISHVLEGGGTIPLIDLVVLRKYPLLYLQKPAENSKESGGTRSRVLSEAEESERIRDFEKRKELLVEKFSDEVEEECVKVRTRTRNRGYLVL
jgi:hypothetical protein